ncbi:hypothetical protein [Psychromonas ossibalaenae]|uniref:hypothetical protein n=1 Tax=Psychromonas ossibalaenae TaxID=444922 RepID=UPI000368F142|nr:hypothetical protein [Psychromonas ossibalaenae]
MGLFDKVKSLKNSITGGAAKVYIDSEPVNFDEPFVVTVRAQIQDASLKVNRVYLQIQGREEVEVPDTDVVYESDGEQERRTEIVTARCSTTEVELTVSEGQVLDANQSYEWQAAVELPGSALPVYKGRYCRHVYIARASLDCFGNDPDSGWQELNEE